ncbi:type IV toxin-antitoxin system AbiEi family antitoxin [Chlorobium phaeovibrioides]|uniref:Transcriptional regulator AbiEi antitoxin N-terminal domain-containing protein n=1 Tax=Chlorobium phaeovibrioides TaxID=1094 RepID=A0ABW9UQG7_CHLPH|nr:type IV toxin-antitoxin system AbiEi family antitoxin [Chlorobium phaeovibrioides]MWV54979.1 hypothetical protein [Chlorobium phaeovibrioides]
MTTNTASKLNLLLIRHIPGTVELASWMDGLGISHDLQQYYRKAGWLEPVGVGASKRPSEQICWEGALYTLQQQGKLPVHAGARTALSLQGYAHYARSDKEPVFLFSPRNTTVPAWFRKYDWHRQVIHEKTSFLAPQQALSKVSLPLFSILVSSPERAMLECLYLAPKAFDLVECYQLMEMLTTLRPKIVQELLEQCRSIRVKRLFLYLSEKAGHLWFNRLDRSRIDLGKGKRVIENGGVLVPDYELVLPNELVSL